MRAVLSVVRAGAPTDFVPGMPLALAMAAEGGGAGGAGAVMDWLPEHRLPVEVAATGFEPWP